MRTGMTPSPLQWCRCGRLRGRNLAESVAVCRRFRAGVGVFWQTLIREVGVGPGSGDEVAEAGRLRPSCVLGRALGDEGMAVSSHRIDASRCDGPERGAPRPAIGLGQQYEALAACGAHPHPKSGGSGVPYRILSAGESPRKVASTDAARARASATAMALASPTRFQLRCPRCWVWRKNRLAPEGSTRTPKPLSFASRIW